MQLSFRFSPLLKASLCWGIYLAWAAVACAESDPAIARYQPPTFFQLASKSGYIFSGTVMSISRIQASPQNIGAVRITFHVENAVRGARKGEMLTIREWAGLWEMGEHYRVGEQVTLFLFPPGRLGLTSTVGGPLGRFKIDPGNHVLLNRGQIGAASADRALQVQWRDRTRLTWAEFSEGIRRLAERTP